MANIAMLRTREIIKHLNYEQLVKNKIIPDLVSVIKEQPNIIAVKRYPPFVYQQKDFAGFGMIMDYIIRAGLRINLNQNVNLGTDPIIDVIPTLPDHLIELIFNALQTYETSNNLNDITNSSVVLSGCTTYNLKDYVGTIHNIIKEICNKWNCYQGYLTGTIKFNTSYKNLKFEGHPDVVTDNAVLDIKTTASFGKMAEESTVQILTYYALMKNVKYVGFILPMQREIAIYNAEGWDCSKFLSILNDTATRLNATLDELDIFKDLNISQKSLKINIIGTHIPKGKSIANSITNFCLDNPQCPCQIFISNPRTGKRSKDTDKQVILAANIIKQNNYCVFIHAPYVINLCQIQLDKETNENWGQKILNEELQYGVRMGCKGVVVHTGASKELPTEQALNNMENIVRNALQYATKECPLLLETPAAEGTDVCNTVEELQTFLSRFCGDERLGLCVDTCHVFSAGYNHPLDYLMKCKKINLIHFNDSAVICGAHKDRHAPPGRGHIGAAKMEQIAQWASQKDIPMIVE